MSSHEPIRDERVPGRTGEPIGAVNAYVARDEKSGVTTHVFTTINLATGVTPFQTTFAYDGEQVLASSLCYTLPFRRVTAAFGWYRPRAAEFRTLSNTEREHVLKGGLLLAALQDAIQRQAEDNPDYLSWPELSKLTARLYGIDEDDGDECTTTISPSHDIGGSE